MGEVSRKGNTSIAEKSPAGDVSSYIVEVSLRHAPFSRGGFEILYDIIYGAAVFIRNIPGKTRLFDY